MTTYVIETSLYFNPPEVLLGKGGRVMEEKVTGKSSDYVLELEGPLAAQCPLFTWQLFFRVKIKGLVLSLWASPQLIIFTI